MLALLIDGTFTALQRLGSDEFCSRLSFRETALWSETVIPTEQKPRVLIVEDELLIADMLQQILEDMGVHVVGPAVTIADALLACEKQELDAAFVDLILRGERADPVATALASKGIPHAFSTGLSPALAMGGWKEHPFIISKPYSAEAIRRVLTAMLTGSAANSS